MVWTGASRLWDLCSLYGSYSIEETICLGCVVVARCTMKRAGLWNLCVWICHLKDKLATVFVVLTEKEEVIRIRAGGSNGVKTVKYEDNKFFSIGFQSTFRTLHTNRLIINLYLRLFRDYIFKFLRLSHGLGGQAPAFHHKSRLWYQAGSLRFVSLGNIFIPVL